MEPPDEGFLEAGNANLRYEFVIIGLFWSVLGIVGVCSGVYDRLASHVRISIPKLFDNLCALPQSRNADSMVAGEGELLGFLLETVLWAAEV